MGARFSTTKQSTHAGPTSKEDMGEVASQFFPAIAPVKMATLPPDGVTSALQVEDDHFYPSAQDTSHATQPLSQDLDSAATCVERNEPNAAPSTDSALEALHSRNTGDDHTTENSEISGYPPEEGSQVSNDYASAKSQVSLDATEEGSQTSNHNASVMSKVSLDSTGEPFQLPEWFLEHCVTLNEAWEMEPDDLVLSGSIRTVDTPRTLFRSPDDDVPWEKGDVEAAVPYEMDESLFKPLLGLVRATQSSRCFTTDVIQLENPRMELPDNDTTSFQMAVVRSLSKTVSADLVVLTTDDVHDFSLKHREILKPLSPSSFERALFPNAERDISVFTALLEASKKKRTHRSGSDNAGSLTIVHLVATKGEDDFIDHRILNYARHAHVALPSPGSYLVIFSTQRSHGHTPLVTDTYNIAPQRSTETAKRISADNKIMTRSRNIRLIQRVIRQQNSFDLPLTIPYTDWGFLDESDLCSILDQPLEYADARGMWGGVGHKGDENKIRGNIGDIKHRRAALNMWTDETDRWSRFPFHAQQALRFISAVDVEEGEENYWEKQAISLIVDPIDEDEAWSLIAMDNELEATFKRLLANHHNQGKDATKQAYGILKREHAGGVLLYGPPGTGKTQLTRVMARQADTVVFYASVADLQSKWCGESPKVVKGFFNLAKLISPSIIFIDEADGLFSSRTNRDGSSTSNFYRATTEQLLIEMDGFTKSQSTPLVILATNIPENLDPAILRRVPNTIYMGLPNHDLRQAIFDIMLKDEILSDDIDSALLASMTPRYTGSDIKNLCIQAALKCDTFVRGGEHEEKRLLTKALFERALHRARPTTTEASLTGIRKFAKEFDPDALRILQQPDVTPPKSRGYYQTSEMPGSQNEDEAHSAGQKEDSEWTERRTLYDINKALPYTTINDAKTPPTGEIAIPLKSFQLPNTGSEDTFQGPQPPEGPIYTPLPLGSKKIRVLSLHPSHLRSDPIKCSMETVDLDDRTSSYNEALAALDTWAGKEDACKIGRGSLRHIFWNFWNLYPEETHSITDDGSAKEVAASKGFYSFSDRPAEKLPLGLLDRFVWGDYLALSYVWGDQSDKKEIILNGSSFLIGPNLYDALLRLRESWEVSTRGLKVWIDAICINQADVTERSVEVKKMTLIYSEAMLVRGWLGQPSDDAGLHFGAIREVFNTAEHAAIKVQKHMFSQNHKASLPAIGPDDFADVKIFEVSSTDDGAYQEASGASEGVPPTSFAQRILGEVELQTLATRIGIDVIEHERYLSLAMKVLIALFKTTYWHRLWIVQEIAMSPSLGFWYGPYFIKASELHCLLASCRKFNPASKQEILIQNDLFANIGESSTIKTSMLTVINFRLTWEDKNDSDSTRQLSSIMRIVDQARRSYATDARDKVYGLLALLPSQISSQVQPSYSPAWTWQKAWMEFAKICVEYDRRLDLIGRCVTPRPKTTGLATWAFDLASVELPVEEPGDLIRESLPTDVVSFADRGLPFSYYFSQEGRFLHCRAAFINTVQAVATRADRGELSDDSFLDSDLSSSHALTTEDIEKTRLSLARTLLGKIDYTFSDGPTLLDVPWSVGEDFITHDYNVPGGLQGNEVYNNTVPWKSVSVITKGNWISKILPFKEFRICGLPLRDYFTSEDELCDDCLRLEESNGLIDFAMGQRRLFTTENGLVGSVTTGVRRGDRIAVLYGCDVPVVLRPRGNEYELVGSCFVDGYMNGEVAGMVDKGETMAEEITIC